MTANGRLPDRQRFDEKGDYYVQQTKEKVMLRLADTLLNNNLVTQTHLPPYKETHYEATIYCFDEADLEKLEQKLFDILTVELARTRSIDMER